MIPDKDKALQVTNQIRHLGIKDIQLFYDRQVKLWAVCQIKQVAQSILTMDNISGTKVEPYILWWCRTYPDSKYRSPGEQDVSDVMAIVQRAQIAFQKSERNPNWLDDQLLEKERVKTEKHKKRQDDNLRYAIKRDRMRKSGLCRMYLRILIRLHPLHGGFGRRPKFVITGLTSSTDRLISRHSDIFQAKLILQRL
jgi:hypothetical protein